MYILKTSSDDFFNYIYWTLDGERIFRVQKTPIFRPKGKDKKEWTR
jgi:hypothetical protein